ncbi:MAG: RNA polymerase sigma-70 factor [Balneola sp.]|nr:RNA polymerase sigma-70 factor [Balneola sp.]
MIKEGDKQAFQKFFDFYYDPLIRYLRARGSSTDVAQDIIQNAFLYIWEHRDQIEEDKSLRSYLYRIAYTRMLNHFKSQNKFNDDATPNEYEYALENPEEELKGKELMEIVQNAIDGMPEKRKAVFELCFMQEFTYKETAEMMSISKNTVENHMTKAFKDVRIAVNYFYELNPNQISG